jgi:hypothetical protein
MKSRRMRWAAHMARMGYKKGFNRVSVGKPEVNGTLVRPIRRWKNNIKMDL